MINLSISIKHEVKYSHFSYTVLKFKNIRVFWEYNFAPYIKITLYLQIATEFRKTKNCWFFKAMKQQTTQICYWKYYT